MRSMIHAGSATLGLLLLAAPLQAQEAAIRMQGRCERLVLGGQDITQNCREQLVNSVMRGRTSFDFTAWDGQTLSFSGSGPQQEGTEITDPSQPINMIVPGRKEKDAIVRNPAPAAGSCRFSSPEPGRTQIACEATSQGKLYAGTFVTEAKGADAKAPEVKAPEVKAPEVKTPEAGAAKP